MGKNETKEEKFKRIATRRVKNIISKIENVGKLSSPSYEYTDEEVEKIFGAIQEALDNAKVLFSAKRPKKKEFSL